MHCRQSETRGEPSALIDKYPAYRKRAPVGPLLRLEVGGKGRWRAVGPKRCDWQSAGSGDACGENSIDEPHDWAIVLGRRVERLPHLGQPLLHTQISFRSC
jgi:hypothetical protein